MASAHDEGPGTNAGVGWDPHRGYQSWPSEHRDGWNRFPERRRRRRRSEDDPDHATDLVDELREHE